MEKQFYDKYGKEFHCATCQELTTCVNRPEPLFPNCCEQYLRDKIAELEEQLKNAIVLPKELQVGNKVYFIDVEEKYIHKGKIYSITKELNYEENGFITWVYCRYNDCLTFTHPIRDYGVELFATEEEAQSKLKELQGEINE